MRQIYVEVLHKIVRVMPMSEIELPDGVHKMTGILKDGHGNTWEFIQEQLPPEVQHPIPQIEKLQRQISGLSLQLEALQEQNFTLSQDLESAKQAYKTSEKLRLRSWTTISEIERILNNDD